MIKAMIFGTFLKEVKIGTILNPNEIYKEKWVARNLKIDKVKFKCLKNFVFWMLEYH